jgi:hypothetical protein
MLAIAPSTADSIYPQRDETEGIPATCLLSRSSGIRGKLQSSILRATSCAALCSITRYNLSAAAKETNAGLRILIPVIVRWSAAWPSRHRLHLACIRDFSKYLRPVTCKRDVRGIRENATLDMHGVRCSVSGKRVPSRRIPLLSQGYRLRLGSQASERLGAPELERGPGVTRHVEGPCGEDSVRCDSFWIPVLSVCCC